MTTTPTDDDYRDAALAHECLAAHDSRVIRVEGGAYVAVLLRVSAVAASSHERLSDG